MHKHTVQAAENLLHGWPEVLREGNVWRQKKKRKKKRVSEKRRKEFQKKMKKGRKKGRQKGQGGKGANKKEEDNVKEQVDPFGAKRKDRIN
jgi:hypothetical protein